MENIKNKFYKQIDQENLSELFDEESENLNNNYNKLKDILE